MQRIRKVIRYPDSAHMTCFNSTPLERTLGARSEFGKLGVIRIGASPARAHSLYVEAVRCLDD